MESKEDDDIIKGERNSGKIRLDRTNKHYPLVFSAQTEDGKTVRVRFTPSAADALGRQLIGSAIEALALWTGVDRR